METAEATDGAAEDVSELRRRRLGRMKRIVLVRAEVELDRGRPSARLGGPVWSSLLLPRRSRVPTDGELEADDDADVDVDEDPNTDRLRRLLLDTDGENETPSALNCTTAGYMDSSS